ncbi:hypothetical protein COO60DRAFT_1703115 [Scenedesmus sp. NREL 46B-D3]|nr:hypothetical protein COO60DRAFT_1703115 [Scenedesmus sp. NREL 46B-D3]
MTVLLLLLLCVPACLAASEGVAGDNEPKRCDWGADTVVIAPPGMSALVLGGTGAVGHHIVQQLLASDQWSRVITVGRREVALPEGQPGASKLQQVVVDMDALQAQAGGSFSGVDAVFCALGTTRLDAGGGDDAGSAEVFKQDAGSAEVFKKVDHEYVAAAAAAAQAAGVPYFGLVSAAGANAGLPSADWRLLHPLLYTRTKGLAEEAVKGQGFVRAGIFRPGMLDRGDKARAIEKWFAPLTGAIPVADVAKAMVADAAAFKAGSVSGVGVLEMKDLKEAAAAAAAAAPSQQ